MIKTLLLIISIVLALSFLTAQNDYIFLPTDILNYFPSFTAEFWQRPHNSLLADPVFQFEPWRVFAKESLFSGKIPLWNDLNGAGAPFLANPQTALFYPLNLIYYLFEPDFSLTAIHGLKFLLFGYFTYYYLVTLGRSRFASLLGTMAASTAFMVMWLQWPHTNVYLLFPALLLITERMNKSKKKRGYLLLQVIAYFLAILGGHPETLFNIFIIHSLYIWLTSRSFKSVLKNFAVVLIASGMAAFVLLPFFEYLLHSYSYQIRSSVPHFTFIPLEAFVLQVVPFLFGAPHTEFYKSLAPFTNFQEYMSGYVGIIVIAVSLVTILKYKSIPIVRNSCVIVLFSLFSSFLLYYFLQIVPIPILSINANQRFISFAGFFLAVIFAYGVDKKNFSNVLNLFTLRLTVLMVTVLTACLFFIQKSGFEYQSDGFVVYLSKHVYLIAVSTVLFFFALARKAPIFKVMLLTCMFIQTIYLFYNYNSFNKKQTYYPSTQLTKALRPGDRILEVGNHSLPENFNLVYGVGHAQNYDAIEVRWYREEFDKVFAANNPLEKVEGIAGGKLEKFGISKIVSDYDVNYRKLSINSDGSKSISASELKPITLKNVSGELVGLRILTQTYNRVNSCVYEIRIAHLESGKNTNAGILDCGKVRDNSFYTIPINNFSLRQTEVYEITLQPINLKPDNSIALLGDDQGVPYGEILIQGETQLYPKIYSNDKVYVNGFVNSSLTVRNGSYGILYKDKTRINIKTHLQNAESIDLKWTYFPGWVAEVDGERVPIKRSEAFMQISVPEGDHVVDIYYKPFSFTIGVVLSALTAFSLLLFIIKRTVFKNHRKFLKKLRLKSKSQSPIRHSLVIVLFFSVAVCFYSLFLATSPVRLDNPNTTTINWLTVNNYPKNQDIFYFIIGVLFVVIATITQWYLWIISKKL